jgi:hypothetical protein
MSRFDRPTYKRFFNALSSAHLVEQLRDRRRRVEGIENLYAWLGAASLRMADGGSRNVLV